MLQKIITPKNNHVNLSFDIPNDYVGKKLKVTIEHSELSDETKKMLDERLKDYYDNPNDVMRFSDTIKKVRQELL